MDILQTYSKQVFISGRTYWNVWVKKKLLGAKQELPCCITNCRHKQLNTIQ